MLGRCERSRKTEGRTRAGGSGEKPVSDWSGSGLSIRRAAAWCGAESSDRGSEIQRPVRRRSRRPRCRREEKERSPHAPVTLLQSCSLSPGQKIVLLRNRGPLRPDHGTGASPSSQRALLCKCGDACGN